MAARRPNVSGWISIILTLTCLAACGDSGTGGTGTRVTYTVSGVVSNLIADGLVLQLNGGDDLALFAASTAFEFTSGLTNGQSYAVTVKQSPASQTCQVTRNASGQAASTNVTGIAVQCTGKLFTLGGNISSLQGQGLVIEETNSHGTLTLDPGATSWTISPGIETGSNYTIVVQNPTNPSQTCSAANAAGVMAAANATNIDITCTTNEFALGGTVTGLAGQGLTLRDSKSNQTVTVQPNGLASIGFAFSNPVASGSDYTVTVTQPPTKLNQTCSVQKGDTTDPAAPASKVGSAPVTSIAVVCTTSSYGVGGTVSGLPAGVYDILLRDTKHSIAAAISGNGTFKFPYAPCDGNGNCGGIPDGSSYQVTLEEPSDGRVHCFVTNQSGNGLVAGGEVTSIHVQCGYVKEVVGATVAQTNDGTTYQNFVVLVYVSSDTGGISYGTAPVLAGNRPAPIVFPPNSTKILSTDPRMQATGFVATYTTGAPVPNGLVGYTLDSGPRGLGPGLSGGGGAITSAQSLSTPTFDPSGQFGFLLSTGAANSIVTYSVAASATPYSIAVGSNPTGLPALTPDGHFAYQLDAGSSPGTGGILQFSVASGQLASIPGGPAANLHDPRFLKVDPTGRFAYLYCGTSPPYDPTSPPAVLAYRIDPSTGALTYLNQVAGSAISISAVIPAEPLLIDPSGTYVFVLNAPPNGFSAYQIGSDGHLSAAPGSPFKPGLPQDIRSGLVDPSGKFLFVLAARTSNIVAYSINLTPAAGTDALTPIGVYATGDDDSGGAGLAIDPTGKFLYVANESSYNSTSASVSSFYVDPSSGTLTRTPGSPLSLRSYGTDGPTIASVAVPQ